MDEVIVGIDTATVAGSVALYCGGRVVASCMLNVIGVSHSAYILRHIDLLLRECGLDTAALTACAVVIGPGSFTGLRVGMATAQGLAIGRNLPLMPVSSLQTIAYACGRRDMPVCAVIDARKHEVYAAVYRWQNSLPVPQGEEMVFPAAALREHIDSPTLVVGSGVAVYRRELLDALGDMAQLVDDTDHWCLAAAAIKLALCRGKTVNYTALLPAYVRASDAELQRRSDK